MLSALIVEQDPAVARHLRDLVERERYRVVGVVEDIDGALETVDAHHVDLALVDIELARRTSGYHVACELAMQGVRCVFVAGILPAFPMPELALGCIAKPFTAEAVRSALEVAAAQIKTDHLVAAPESPGFMLY